MNKHEHTVKFLYINEKKPIIMTFMSYLCQLPYLPSQIFSKQMI